MQKRTAKLLTLLLVLGITAPVSYGASPLSGYDLYKDTHANEASNDGSREQVMGEFYSNSLAAKRAKRNASSSNVSPVPKSTPSYSQDGSSYNLETPKRRNEVLRESSKEVHADSSKPADWTTAVSFYKNPSLSSIIQRYKRSDFAGCMQESISYVKKHPKDTLGFYYLAMSYAKVNDKENAIKAYEKVISLNANPMIVKYATNGRNCVMNPDADNCYQKVNEPEYIYPYANIAQDIDLTPVDPKTLVNKNLSELQSQIIPASDSTSQGKDGEKKEGVKLPFGEQDSKLDEFINAPYGNGLAPELDKEYKEQQLRKLQKNINDNNNSAEDFIRNIKNIKNFDQQN